MLLKKNTLDLLGELIKTSFKMRYQNSVLGILWVLIKPYATFIVLFLVWSRLRRSDDIEFFSLYLLSGIIFFTYFNEMIILGQMALIDKANIILKVNFPRQIAIIAALVNGLINLGINSILLLVFILLTGIQLSASGILYFLFITISMFLGCLGVSLFTSIVTIRFRDLKNIFELGLFLLYWVTPIFYSVDHTIFGDTFIGTVVRYNPLTLVLNEVRASLGIYGRINIEYGIIILTVSLILLILGWIFFNKKIKYVAEFF